MSEDNLIQCHNCDEWKSPEEFNIVSKSKPYPRSICKSCEAERNREWKLENREKQQENANEYYQEHKEEIIKAAKVRRNSLRDEILDEYGGKCTCCGESHKEFLSVDHIAGGGGEHRRTLAVQGGNYARKLYAQIKDEGFPKDKYQILCLNCNIAKWRYGVCPHQKEKRNG